MGRREVCEANFNEFPVMGKTGTCSNNGTRFGWFASYAETPTGRIVTVIFLEGGRPTFGPKAAELTGQFYRGDVGPELLPAEVSEVAATNFRVTPAN